MWFVNSISRIRSVTSSYYRTIIRRPIFSRTNVYVSPVYSVEKFKVRMSQRSITSFFSKAGKKSIESAEDSKPKTSTKRQRLDSSGSESGIPDNPPDSPPIAETKKRTSKRQRIESTSSEASTPKTSPIKKITVKAEKHASPTTKTSPKTKKSTGTPKQSSPVPKVDSSPEIKVENTPDTKKSAKKTKEKPKTPLIERNIKVEKEKSSEAIKEEKVTPKKENETNDIVPEDQYNPAKAKYDPIKDACWSKGQEVPYLALAKTLEAIEATSARLKIVEILSNYFRSVMALTPEDLLPSVYMCLNQLAPAYHSLELGIAETYLMKAVGQCTGRSLSQVKSALQKSGDLGLVAEQARSSQKTMFTPAPLKARKVFAALKEIAHMTGQASVNKKIAKIQTLYVACRHSEARYLIRSLAGKLRIGLAEQSVLQALGSAAAQHEAKKPLVGDDLKAKIDEYALVIKTTYCECPNYEAVIPALLSHGALHLPQHCRLSPGIPLKPMLAHPTKGVREVFNRFEGVEFTCEWKYDGERAQIHVPSKEGAADLTNAAIFSRNQENNTSKYPDILRRLPSLLAPAVVSCVLDCEAVAYDVDNKRILPFQILSTRKRKDATEADIKVQVCVFVFDLLYLNGKALVKEPLRTRRELLREHFKEVPGEWEYAKGQDCSTTEEVQSWLEESVQGSCEGLMVKTLDGPQATYEIARRSHNWLKIKKDYLEGVGDTIDAVVIGAYRGKGKRAGYYGGFLLACYDPDNEEYQSLCRVGTGFSDEDLQKFTESLKEHVIEAPRNYYRYDTSHEPDAWLSCVVVWEVRCADLSLSPSHRAAIALVEPDKGISLRFPRFIRVRDDKTPEQATSARQIAQLYLSQDQLKNQPATATVNDDFY